TGKQAYLRFGRIEGKARRQKATAPHARARPGAALRGHDRGADLPQPAYFRATDSSLARNCHQLLAFAVGAPIMGPTLRKIKAYDPQIDLPRSGPFSPVFTLLSVDHYHGLAARHARPLV